MHHGAIHSIIELSPLRSPLTRYIPFDASLNAGERIVIRSFLERAKPLGLHVGCLSPFVRE